MPPKKRRRSSVDPFLTFSSRRDLRERVWKKFKSRGDNEDANDTKATIARIVKLRAVRASSFGIDAAAILDTNLHTRLNGNFDAASFGREGLAVITMPREIALA